MDTKRNDLGSADDATSRPGGSRADSVGGTPLGAMPGSVDPGIEDSYWRESWRSRPYFSDDYTYDDYAPAYRSGWEAWSTHGTSGKRFEDVEPQLRSHWETSRGSSKLGWEKAKLAVRDAWDRVKQGLGVAGSTPRGGGDAISGASSQSSRGGVGSAGAVRDADAFGTPVGTTSAGGGSTLGGSSLGGGMSGAGMGGSGIGAGTGTGATPGAPASYGASGSLSGGAMGAGSMSGSSLEGAGGASIVGASGVGGVDTAKGGLGTGGVANDVSGGGYRSGDGFNYGYAGTSTSTPDVIERNAGDDAGGDGDADVRILNSYLRGEISACETYRQAISRLGAAYPQLADGLSSHERRVGLLKDRIRALGGEPASGSGLWGAWAKLVQAGADLFGERSAIAALESGEDHGRNDYQRELANLSASVRTWVESALLPEEERTHAMLSDLKHAHV